jgi:dihydroflavonol-4-reductase
LVYVGDLIKGIYQCALSEKSKNQTYFLGGHQDEYTWPYLGELAAKLLNVWAVKLRVPHFVIFTIAYIYEFDCEFIRQGSDFQYTKR